MTKTKSALRVLAVFIVILGIPVAVELSLRWLPERFPFSEPVLKRDLQTMESKQLEISIEADKLLITLATAVFGAAGFLLRSTANAQTTSTGQPPKLYLLALSLVFAGASILFGYVSYTMMVWMLSKGFFNLYNWAVHYPRIIQFWSFIFSMVWIALFWLHLASKGGGGKKRTRLVSLMILTLVGWHALTGQLSLVRAQSQVAPMPSAPTPRESPKPSDTDSGEMLIEQATREGLRKWAASRNCGFTYGAEEQIVRMLLMAKPVIDAKKQQYNLLPPEEQRIVRAAVASFLDAVAIQAFGPLKKNCTVDAMVLTVAFNAQAQFAPSTGYLTVDGSQRGSPILIDGQKKGNITQSFLLSVGKHRVQTMKCDEWINIAANDDKQMYCSKR